VSSIEPRFEISPYSFKLKSGGYSLEAIKDLLDDPPRLLSDFMDSEANRLLTCYSAKAVGISCIGQEQLLGTLLLAKAIKRISTDPILIGGTILSRMYDRGVLARDWFGQCFDIVVRNEGERPLADILELITQSDNWRNSLSEVPSIVFREIDEGLVTATQPCEPLTSREVPIPNFDGMPLSHYYSPEITLPILTSRGCYWGKCEFCHHGMVYGDKYSANEMDRILSTVSVLSEKYSCKAFSFNDEAIPPKIFRRIGKEFPSSADTRWIFTGLVKFEKYFTHEDFRDAYRIGFRSLYVGLESASERVLSLMKKNCTRTTMLQNLVDANRAGIWVHCFAFFGFPGERPEEAQETYDFLLENGDIIGSVGCGTFSLEHGAPIQRGGRYRDFGITILPDKEDTTDVYYRYEISNGLSAEEAEEWSTRFNSALFAKPEYYSVSWIPREHLLLLLRDSTCAALKRWGMQMDLTFRLPGSRSMSEFVVHDALDEDRIVCASKINLRAVYLSGSMKSAFELLQSSTLPLKDIAISAAPLLEKLFNGEDDTVKVLNA
jgi:hypothetical protein